jgi:UDP-N-acetylmuramoyl-tripeptide--D-alanyl-D-alanine ligase
MKLWQPERVASAARARLAGTAAHADSAPGPLGASVDSRTLAAGELFIGLRGERADGGEHAAAALAAGAWGVLVTPEHARSAIESAEQGVVLAHPDPLSGLQALARAWRAELGDHGARVVAITGSTGKTSTKDILASLLSARLRVVASPQNLNTEIGMPLAILAAPLDTQALVLELAMRGPGQIAELTAIAQPDVGVIVNVGPVHLELLGSLEAIAAAKAELIAGLAPGATLVLPAGEPLLEPYRRSELETITFGPGGDVELLDGAGPGEPGSAGAGQLPEVAIRLSGAALSRERAGASGQDARVLALRPSFRQAHNLRNLLAAVAAARGLGVSPQGELAVSFSSLRGERLELPDGIVLINDCYNANPMSMRAALDDLAEIAAKRRVAVLGEMLELGEGEREFHREIGLHAAERGVELLLTVGPLASEMAAGFAGEIHSVNDAHAAAEILPALLQAGDTVLIKGSRGVGLELVADALRERADAGGGQPRAGLFAGPRAR